MICPVSGVACFICILVYEGVGKEEFLLCLGREKCEGLWWCPSPVLLPTLLCALVGEAELHHFIDFTFCRGAVLLGLAGD